MSDFSTVLTKVNDNYFPMIERQLTGNGIEMDEYSKSCVLNAISAINTVLDSKSIGWNDEKLDRSNITQTLIQIASLKLNAAASPREVYFQLRNLKVKGADHKDIWKKQIEMGIEGDGNDAILARFGRDVKKVGQFWLVRENDPFTYPQYTGFDVVAPTWTPTGKGNVVRVVYPILKVDGTVEYYIAERDDVIRNLVAHMNNQMMNETFGVCEDRYKATAEQRKEIAARKARILQRASEKGLAALDDAEMQVYMSPAWTEPQSRESMLIRKMRNNVVKKIPKDFGNFLIERSYQEASDETLRELKKEIAQHANQTVIDVEPLTPSSALGVAGEVEDLDDSHEPISGSDQPENKSKSEQEPDF
ncbi:hypothetical protein QCD85_05990 [Paenibacillus sp. PsM32]|uniref:hypothetical protein n=1 Tax=unclassified Paenibacillus TaxID=185978 RepID=UPI00236654EF|nr:MULTISPECIES: hypothetical protein [unclassified Paenibacillus]MDN4617640.1 hypothetical protein [Paenibacillus sp. PsM32]WDF52903.1 hypothetical protein PQ460_10960 [Paenibacillus sp. KACC 21273]